MARHTTLLGLLALLATATLARGTHIVNGTHLAPSPTTKRQQHSARPRPCAHIKCTASDRTWQLVGRARVLHARSSPWSPQGFPQPLCHVITLIRLQNAHLETQTLALKANEVLEAEMGLQVHAALRAAHHTYVHPSIYGDFTANEQHPTCPSAYWAQLKRQRLRAPSSSSPADGGVRTVFAHLGNRTVTLHLPRCARGGDALDAIRDLTGIPPRCGYIICGGKVIQANARIPERGACHTTVHHRQRGCGGAGEGEGEGGGEGEGEGRRRGQGARATRASGGGEGGGESAGAGAGEPCRKPLLDMVMAGARLFDEIQVAVRSRGAGVDDDDGVLRALTTTWLTATSALRAGVCVENAQLQEGHVVGGGAEQGAAPIVGVGAQGAAGTASAPAAFGNPDNGGAMIDALPKWGVFSFTLQRHVFVELEAVLSCVHVHAWAHASAPTPGTTRRPLRLAPRAHPAPCAAACCVSLPALTTSCLDVPRRRWTAVVRTRLSPSPCATCSRRQKKTSRCSWRRPSRAWRTRY